MRGVCNDEHRWVDSRCRLPREPLLQCPLQGAEDIEHLPVLQLHHKNTAIITACSNIHDVVVKSWIVLLVGFYIFFINKVPDRPD